MPSPEKNSRLNSHRHCALYYIDNNVYIIGYE